MWAPHVPGISFPKTFSLGCFSVLIERDSKKGSEKVLGRVLGKGSEERGPFSRGFTVKSGSQKGALRILKGVFRRCLECPFGEYDPLGVRPIQGFAKGWCPKLEGQQNEPFSLKTCTPVKGTREAPLDGTSPESMGHTPSTAGTFRKKFQKNSGKTRKRSQSVSWNFPREYGWDAPSPITQGI